ncbi:Kinesin-like protein kif21b [Chamberlinius hualienensis]
MMDETSVRVAVRIRPQLPRELIELRRVCTSVTPGEPQVWLANEKAFTFDYVFDTSTDQPVIYDTCVNQLIEGCFEGYNATVLAYGQTGSGKTHTMGTGFEVNSTEDDLGIIPRAIDHLFGGIEQRRQNAYDLNQPLPDFKIHCQFIELYNEEIVDLLDDTRDSFGHRKKSGIRIHENSQGGIYTVGVTSKTVTTKIETLQCLKIGALSRTTASTQMNSQSSRSHAIFTIYVTQQRVAGIKDTDGELDAEQDNLNDIETLTSKFHFVDLAGSERLKRTGATGDRVKESISINSGLLALGNVISALGDVTKIGCHVPYRDSKLTRLLQDSLGGNSQTLMIACIAPSDCDFMETLNTLNYANRAKNIKNRIVVNQDKTSKTISMLRHEIQQLQLELMEYKQGKRVLVDGEETVNDMYHEITMLQTDNNNLRTRLKAMQETIENITANHAELLAEKELGKWISSNENSDAGDLDINAIVRGYMTEIEKLRAKLLESEHSCEGLRKSLSRSQARLSMSPVYNQTMSVALDDFYGPPADTDDGVQDLIEIAKQDITRMHEVEARQRTRIRHVSAESDSDFPLRQDLAEDDNDQQNDVSEDEDSSESDGGTAAVQLQSDLAQISMDISIKQRLIDELENSHRKLETMRHHYEEKLLLLQNKIRETQQERDRVLSNLSSVENLSDEKVKRVKEDYEKKINNMTVELKRIQVARKEHAMALKNQSQYERQMKTLREELNEMKKTKVRLMNKNKEDTQKHKELEQRKNRELAQLRKHNLKVENQCRTLEAEKRLKDAVLKRKQEEVFALRKMSKPMSDKVAGRVPSRNGALNRIRGVKGTSAAAIVPFSPKAAKSRWVKLEKQINEMVLRKQTVAKWEQQMETWLQERTELNKKMENLIKKRENYLAVPKLANSLQAIDLTEEINNLGANIRYLQSNITECQQHIVQMEESKEGRDFLDTSSFSKGMAMEEMDYLCGKLLNMAVSQSVIATQKDCSLKEMEAKVSEVTQNEKIERELLHHLIVNKRLDFTESIYSNGNEDFDLNNVSEPTTRSSSPFESASTADLHLLPPATSNESLATAMPPPVPPTKSQVRRRRTATTDELLYGLPSLGGVGLAGNYAIPDIGEEDSATHEYATDYIKISKSLTNPHSTDAPPSLSLAVEMLVASSQSEPSLSQLRIAGTSHSSATFSYNNNFSSITRPVSPSSPPLFRKQIPIVKEDNVFHRLASSSSTSSQSQPDQGTIEEYIGKPFGRYSPFTCTHVARGHSKPVLCMDATNRLLFTGSKDRTVKMWDLERGVEVLSLDDHSSHVTTVRYCERTRQVFTASSAYIKVWDVRIGSVKCIKSLHSSGISASGSVATTNVKVGAKLSDGEQPINDFLVDPFGTCLYSAAGNSVRTWDLRRFTAIGKLVGGHQAAVMCLAAEELDDGQSVVVTGSKDHYIKVFEFTVLTGGIHPAKHNLEPPHYDGIQALAIANSSLFSGSRDGYIKKWDIHNAELLQSISQPHRDWVCGLTILPGNEMLLSGCRNGTVALWSTKSCTKLGECRAHDKPMHAISCNSSSIFTASDDTTVRFWKLKSSSELS